jgi:hypothetical protein
MKYIKQYEENTEPQIGDYAIVKDSVVTINDAFADFLSENIGEIVDNKYSYRYPFLVQFENIPDNLKIEFSVLNGYEREFNRNEIIAFSPNKEDLELIISANKYNL